VATPGAGEPSGPVGRSEDAWIEAVSRRFVAGPRVLVGIGHDAAVVRLDGPDVVLKTDTVIDGVDFVLAACGARAAARKAVSVTVSDLAACAAWPRAVLVSVVLPRGADFALFDGLGAGIAEAAGAFACDVVGGDTSVADGPLVLTVMAAGEPMAGGPRTRAGARPGDEISVTGPLGGSILGRHLTFTPRLAEAAALVAADVVHAMMDVSDGLSVDLPRLCAASHVDALVDEASVPVHEDATRLAREAPGGRTAIEHALHDGEDFELLVAHAPLSGDARRALGRAGVVLHRIGTLEAGSGRVSVRRGGGVVDLERGGYDHLRRP
jgi:thiamine-monophosphate kinase